MHGVAPERRRVHGSEVKYRVPPAASWREPEARSFSITASSACIPGNSAECAEARMVRPSGPSSTAPAGSGVLSFARRSNWMASRVKRSSAVRWSGTAGCACLWCLCLCLCGIASLVIGDSGDSRRRCSVVSAPPSEWLCAGIRLAERDFAQHSDN